MGWVFAQRRNAPLPEPITDMGPAVREHPANRHLPPCAPAQLTKVPVRLLHCCLAAVSACLPACCLSWWAAMRYQAGGRVIY